MKRLVKNKLSAETRRFITEKSKGATKAKALAALDKFAAIGAGGDTPVTGDEMPDEETEATYRGTASDVMAIFYKAAAKD